MPLARAPRRRSEAARVRPPYDGRKRDRPRFDVRARKRAIRLDARARTVPRSLSRGRQAPGRAREPRRRKTRSPLRGVPGGKSIRPVSHQFFRISPDRCRCLRVATGSRSAASRSIRSSVRRSSDTSTSPGRARAWPGRSSPQTSSIKRSLDNVSPTWMTRSARIARCRPLPILIGPRGPMTSSGPRTRNSIAAHRRTRYRR